MRLFLNLLLFLTFVLCSQAQTSYGISYTGRTFGYYRVPDIQRASGNHCDASAVDLPQVRRVLEEIRKSGEENLLVSLGDNFAPDLNARSVEISSRTVPKDQVTFDYLDTHRWLPYNKSTPQLTASLARGEGVVDFDNVGCFFRLAGFDAVVPGKHDFHFGPERLRELARYMADPSRGGKPVQMLAANVTIETSVIDSPAQSQPAPKPENYAYSGANGSQFGLPGVPLPYLRQFPIPNGVEMKEEAKPGQLQVGRPENGKKIPHPLYVHGWICRGELGAHFDTAGCDELARDMDKGTSLQFKLPAKFGLYPGPSAIQPGVNYFVCASAVDARESMTAKNTICHATFQFHYPLLQWGKGAQPNPQLYVVARNSVVIFGVMDPDLSGEIGAVDNSWSNGNTAFETKVEIVDPHEALSQVLQTCAEDPACAGKRHVLLAQMPLQRAERLAAHLRGEAGGFDVVMAQADEQDATGSLSRTDRVDAGEAMKPLVLVPETAVMASKPDQLRVALANAHIEAQELERTVENHALKSTVELAGEHYSGRIPLWQLMVQAGLAPKPGEAANVDGRAIVQNGILSVMRGYCKADVSMLQERDLYRTDFYAAERPAASELQSLLDRLLWKNDFITCRPITGASLKAVKTASDQFASGAKNELEDAGVAGRNVAMLGMFQDPSVGLVTDGAVVQDLNLYSVATTDYLAEGETGYPTISSAASASERRKESVGRGQFDEITALVCRQLINFVPDHETGGGFCRGSLDAGTYLDPIAMAPYVLPKGMGESGKLRQWAAENWKVKNVLAPVEGNPAELNAQNRRMFSVRLDRADLGYQQNLHSLSEGEQQQRFGGVQAPQPTAPERYDWTADWLVRVTSSGKNIDRFVQADAEYESSGVRQVFTSATGEVTEPFQASLPKDSAGIEAGIETRLFPRHQKNLTGVRLLTSARFETELTSPFVQFQAADGFFNENVPRRNALLAKAGLRYDGERSWLEIGMQTGPDTQVTALTLGGLTCDPGNLEGCLTTTGTIPTVGQSAALPFHVTSARRDQSGAFFNARIHLPLLFKKLDYVIENEGTLYFNRAGDSSADTHYLEVMSHSLVIPVMGNFSIAPKVDLFFFQNKVAGWHIHGYQTSVTAQYRFDWHTGLKWKDVLRYPNPAGAQ